ncbi:Lrp/AsnC family transcriptional regulator [Spelaeicoccus albus]|uniref:DNA-binding Lrp family transcriptional regulator n=1 Tax=Spelaeicoccus albus TaxID=1280376 RepID=A0A7Z0AC38_9MICO|nr:Lrp/AsnC family transcriptional regulator [Spelaeicoccus albus]NYI66928.1 DNA-binding Lrp family transcriptional regulator [Spelaeicoccus albus]
MDTDDALDAGLIRALQEDGRASISDLADEFGISRDLVSQRLHHLTSHEGLRIVAAVDPVFAGHRLLTHVRVSVDGPADPIARKLAELPDPVFVSMVSGSHPLVFESRHANADELHDLLARVRAMPTVQKLQVTTYVKVLKGFFVAGRRGEVVLDELDHELIAMLQDDGRASFRSLSDAVHLSASSVRARVRKLIDAGVIRISALKSGGLSRNRVAIGIGITARGDVEPITRLIMDSPAIDFAARSHGDYDFVATIIGTSSANALDMLEKLRTLPEISSLESWAHLNIIKEDYARAIGQVMG